MERRKSKKISAVQNAQMMSINDEIKEKYFNKKQMIFFMLELFCAWRT